MGGFFSNRLVVQAPFMRQAPSSPQGSVNPNRKLKKNMKRAVMTALVVSLLGGTSALAQGGPLSRVVREAQANSQNQSQSQNQRAAPPQRESPPQQQAAPAQAPAQSQSRGDGGRRGGDGGGRGGAQTPLAGAVQQAQRQQGGWQGQRRPDGQAAQGQGQRPGAQQGPRGGDNRQWQGRDNRQDGRQDGRPGFDRDRRDEPGPLARAVREAQRRDRTDNNRPGYNNGRDRDRDWDRRPVIRPEDRRDRDRNRPRYDQRRFPHYVTPQQRYRWYGPTWRPPVGFYSFRWQWGQTLPWSWYTPNYYIDDYWRYGLPMPPIGCEWVRVGDDAILVDVFSGRIYQVVYNLFW
jgi:Ni/Co efflux regulator RcnB